MDIRKVALAFSFSFGRCATFGTLPVEGLPTRLSLHCVGNEWQRKFVRIKGDALTLVGGGGLQLASSATAGPGEPDGFYQWTLLGIQLTHIAPSHLAYNSPTARPPLTRISLICI